MGNQELDALFARRPQDCSAAARERRESAICEWQAEREFGDRTHLMEHLQRMQQILDGRRPVIMPAKPKRRDRPWLHKVFPEPWVLVLLAVYLAQKGLALL